MAANEHRPVFRVPSNTRPLRLRVVSANLLHAATWTNERLQLVTALLGQHRPDVVCLQELGEGQAVAVGQRLGMRALAAPLGVLGMGTGVLLRSGIEVEGWHTKLASLTLHGFGAAVLRDPAWPFPVTVMSAHLTPFCPLRAVSEARLLANRAWRHGGHGIVAGDINYMPVNDPEPDWSTVPPYNRATRTVLDDGPLRGDRTVVRALARADLTDAADHLAEQRGDPALLAPTGVHGRIRVDQVHVTTPLRSAIRDYARLDHHGLSDHHPIRVDLDLALADPAGRAYT